MYDVVIIGAGPAGLFAGISAAQAGKRTLILEQMPSAGRKLLICGKGRCNITNICDITEMIKNIPGNGVFLHSALRALDNQRLLQFFHQHGVPTKVERGGRVFPVSDKAQDVRDKLLTVFAQYQGELLVNSKAAQIIVENKLVQAVRLDNGKVIKTKALILAAGGASYPKTGSDGSGFILAQACGHTIITPKPSLVPLESSSPHLAQLQGLSLRNVEVSVQVGEKKLHKEFGEMLFTHFGLSGPVILTLSNLVAKHLQKGAAVYIGIDLKPALDQEKLDNRLQRDFDKFSRKQIKNSLGELVPASLGPVLLSEAQIDEDKFTNQITKQERKQFLTVLKDLRFHITKTRPLAEAIVTAGGVSTKEINPKTMQSKLVENLYFAGEVIDIDGYTGGFNLQAAFSTGYVAGSNAAG